MSTAALDWRAYTEGVARYADNFDNGAYIRRSTSYASIVTTTEQEEQRITDLVADLHWAALLSDPVSLEMLEEMATEALAEHKAGLTRDIDELL